LSRRVWALARQAAASWAKVVAAALRSSASWRRWALVGGLVVVDGVAGAQAAARRAHDLGSAAAGGAGPLAVGARRRRLALLVLVLAPLLALAGAIPAGLGALLALLPATLVALAGSPPGVVVGLALLPTTVALPGAVGTLALAGAVGGLLAGPGAVHPLAARVIRLLERGAADRAGPPDRRGGAHRSALPGWGCCPLDWATAGSAWNSASRARP
jgi:hypothetical protein